jgi:glucose-1-phosphate adenylyltransferase
LTYYKSDAILILSGDHLYRMDYGKLIRYHFEKKADITLAVYPVTREDAPRMGLLKASEKGYIEEFAEKPQEQEIIERFTAPPDMLNNGGIDKKEERYLASMGIYVFNTDVLIKSLENEEQVDFGKEIIPSSLGRYKLAAYPFFGYWEDIGTIKTFFSANINLAKRNPEFSLYEPGLPIYTRTRNLPPSRIIGSEIEDSMIVEGSNIIDARICNSIVGVRSIINPGSHLNEVVMMGSDNYDGEELLRAEAHRSGDIPPLGIGKNCRIERTIIDKNARIGNNVTITRKEDSETVKKDLYWVCDGITVLPRGSIIPDDTTI